MEQTVLNTDQIVALNAAAGESRLSGYYLSGGTALAEYYLRHRISDDLDFFIYDEPDSIFLPEFAEKLKALLRSSSIRFERLHDRYQFYFSLHDRGELKIEFARYHFKSLLEPRNINGVRIDSFRDIAANKLIAAFLRHGDSFVIFNIQKIFLIAGICKQIQIKNFVSGIFIVKITDKV